MANELQQTLVRLISKSNILVEKYHALHEISKAQADEKTQLLEEIEQLKKENEQMRQQIEYLTMARVISPNLDDVKQARSRISKLVQDIDKCISQLNQ